MPEYGILTKDNRNHNMHPIFNKEYIKQEHVF